MFELTEEEFNYCEETEHRKHDEKVREMRTEKEDKIEELKNDMATAISLLKKAECTSCIYTDSPCVRGDYPMKDGHCTHHKYFGNEIAVLKVQNEQLTLKLNALEGEIPWKDIKDKSELIKRNVELEAQIKKMKCFLDDYLSWYKNNSCSINELATEAEEILNELKE